MTNSLTNIDVYESVKKWLTRLENRSRSLDFHKSSTKRSALYWLKCFCKMNNQHPDALLLDRKKGLESKNEIEKRKHEEWAEDFIADLRRKGRSPNTIATAVGMVRSFYRWNHVRLQEVSSVQTFPVKEYKLPTPREIKKMCKFADSETKAWILCQKDCGLANVDLLSLRLNNRSNKFGTIRSQLKNGIEPIHIQIRRQKTSEPTDSFFGPNAIEALNELNLERQSIFTMSVRAFQKKVKEAGIRARVATKTVPITPYCLRRFFNTYMKMGDPDRNIPGVNRDIVEMMMGHSIGRVKSAYLKPPIDKLAKIYMNAYPIIDIRRA